LASNKGRAYFALAGYHLNPDDITRMLGIEPTSINAAGASSSLDKPVISSWELSTQLNVGEVDTYELTRSLLKQLEPVKDKILEVIKAYNLSPRMGLVLVLSADKEETPPEVGFGSRAIRFMADIGAFVNVEYNLAPD
jgi:hypothetical protein